MSQDILSIASHHPVMQEQLLVIEEKERQMPGSMHYTITRYNKDPYWSLDEAGMMVYHYKKETPESNFLELRFCLMGSVYCQHNGTPCAECRLNPSKGCRTTRKQWMS
jgi:hypothetical protein